MQSIIIDRFIMIFRTIFEEFLLILDRLFIAFVDAFV